jgi:hypothetical protein
MIGGPARFGIAGIDPQGRPMQSNEPGSAAAGIEPSPRAAANQGPLGVVLTVGGSVLFAAGAVWITGLALDEFGRLGAVVLWGNP